MYTFVVVINSYCIHTCLVTIIICNEMFVSDKLMEKNKVLWRCNYCNIRLSSKRNVLLHISKLHKADEAIPSMFEKIELDSPHSSIRKLPDEASRNRGIKSNKKSQKSRIHSKEKSPAYDFKKLANKFSLPEYSHIFVDKNISGNHQKKSGENLEFVQYPVDNTDSSNPNDQSKSAEVEECTHHPVAETASSSLVENLAIGILSSPIGLNQSGNSEQHPCLEGHEVTETVSEQSTEKYAVVLDETNFHEGVDNDLASSGCALISRESVDQASKHLSKRKTKFKTPFKTKPRGKCHMWPECVKCSIDVDCGNCVNCCDKSKQ